MLIKTFKNKWFWILWLIISVVTGGIGFFHSYQTDEILKNSKKMYCHDYRINSNYLTIEVLNDLDKKKEYIGYYKGAEGVKNFKFEVLKEGQEVLVIDSVSEFPLVKIGVNRKSTMLYPTYSEYWVLRDFLKE